MKFRYLNGVGLAGVLSALIFAPAVHAADAAPSANPAVTADSRDMDGEVMRSASDIVVLANIGYRNHSDAAEPTLVYDTEYFQRFEPLTAGDALKRVPSVTFLSDVIESDGVRLRGLAPAYTQILINGERVPGSSVDRSFFMDRIPAELIDRVEIVRSSSARRTGDAMAGTLNIVLRDGLQLDGGYIRVGGLSYDDNELEPSLGLVYGGKVGPGRLLVGLNLQGRHNPKRKTSLRYKDSPENNPNYAVEDFDNREDQRDTRDGKDYSANASYTIESDTTKFVLDGFYVKTDRTETERSFEYESPTAFSGPVNEGGALTTDNSNIAKIDQENYTIGAKLSHEWSLGKTTVKAGFARFDEDRRETENEIGFDEDDGAEFEGGVENTRIKDTELSFRLEHEVPVVDGIDIVFGGFWQDKDRKTDINKADANAVGGVGRLLTRWDQFTRNPDTLVAGYDEIEYDPGNRNRIKEQRRDGFILIEGKGSAFSWEAGVRYEHTDVKIDNLTPRADDPSAPSYQTNKYGFWLPSASLRYNLTPRDRITASVARTVRRPDFNYITPATLEGELGDNDLRGNPLLKPESAWGFDLGYEHRIGATGVVGINLFYRDVTNLIELYNTLEEGDEGDGTFIYQPRNVGKGKVYGVEFDMSTSLGFIGLRNTGLFGNFSWLDSEVTDEFGERRFNGQSKYVYNFGAIQDFPRAGVATGVTYRKQANAFDRTVGEEVVTNYGGDLEIFIEKRFGKTFTIRAVGSNLLNGRKNEAFNKFNTLEEQQKRKFDEYELESEQAGPLFQIMARMAF